MQILQSHPRRMLMRHNKKLSVSLATIIFAFAAAQAHAAYYDVDPIYSSVIFKVQHLGGYTIGLFNRFGGVIEMGDDGRLVSVNATVDVRSVYTRNGQRDSDLLGTELFDAVKFPRAQFSSKKIEGSKVTGDITIKGKTKEVVLDCFLGETKTD